MNPLSVDLRPTVEIVEDQGQIGSCTANASVEALQIIYERANKPVALSRLYLYYWERQREGMLAQEGLKNLVDSAITLQSRGVCQESLWPYTPTLTENAQPPATCDTDAANYRVLTYVEPDNAIPAADQVAAIETYLAKGMPVVFSCFLTMDFANKCGQNVSWKTMSFDAVPSITNTVFGEHAMVIIGYDHNLGMFLVQNSWGPAWGDGGFCGISYNNLMHMMLDHYIWTSVTGVDIVNAGWKPDTLDTFNTLMNWAEKTYSLPAAQTQKFMQYYYRSYGTIDYGLDTNTMHIVSYTNGTFTDLGPWTDWLTKAGITI